MKLRILVLALLSANLFAQAKPGLTDTQKLTLAKLQIKAQQASSAQAQAQQTLADIQKQFQDLQTTYCGAGSTLQVVGEDWTCVAPKQAEKTAVPAKK